MRGLQWYVARHYLGARHGRGLLSLSTGIALGGVTVGVTVLVVVIAVMSGMQEDLRAKILESTPHVIVQERAAAYRLRDWEATVADVLEVEGVVGASPFALSMVSVLDPASPDLRAQVANLYGVSIDSTATASTDFEERILEGMLSLRRPESGLPPLLLGHRLADRMAVTAGDTVVLISPENLTREGVGLTNSTPTLRQFEVTGTFTTGMYDYDLRNVYTTLEAAQDLLGLPAGTASGIGVRVEDPERADEVAVRIGEHLGPGYFSVSWVETNRAFFSQLRLQKRAMGVILFLIVLVAAFNIVSTLVMVVSDRTREIGILRAMGMTRRGILGVFVLQGAWVGVTGTAIGTVAGILLSWLQDRFGIVSVPAEIYFVDRLPAQVQPLDVLLIVGGSVAVAFVATIYPALQASRLEPVDAIRHD